MFTGIIDHCGIITNVVNNHLSYRFTIETTFSDLVLGESVAVDGICLTVTDIKENSFCCDVSPETLRATSAGDFAIDKQVNLERALQLTSRLGGHMVSGHIDQVAEIKSITQFNEFTQIECSGVSKINMPYLIMKGSIAMNGVSLTVNDVSEDGFSVMLIPHTLSITNLSDLKANNKVNIEFDMVAKIIFEQTQKYKSL